MSLVKGFNYATQKAVAHTRAQWAGLLESIIERGGRRRVENGETFAHDACGVLVFEVYANIAAPALADVSDLL